MLLAEAHYNIIVLAIDILTGSAARALRTTDTRTRASDDVVSGQRQKCGRQRRGGSPALRGGTRRGRGPFLPYTPPTLHAQHRSHTRAHGRACVRICVRVCAARARVFTVDGGAPTAPHPRTRPPTTTHTHTHDIIIIITIMLYIISVAAAAAADRVFFAVFSYPLALPYARRSRRAVAACAWGYAAAAAGFPVRVIPVLYARPSVI